MVVSGFVFGASCPFLFEDLKARKKRSFFPEDIVDSNSLFHLCLLFKIWSPLASRGMQHILRAVHNSIKQKTLHPPQGRRVLSAVPPRFAVSLDLRLANALVRNNGRSRQWLLAYFTTAIPLTRKQASSVFIIPFRGRCAPDGRCAGLSPRSPNSLTG